MKLTLFAQAPYRNLPEDFEDRFSSVCDTPYGLTTPEGIYSAVNDVVHELLVGARAGFDGLALTEHGQSSFDIMPNPTVVAGALAHVTEAESLDVAIFPMGRALGKTREPLRVAEEYAMLDVLSGGRLVAGFPIGLSYDANINNGLPPTELRPRFEENLQLVLRAWHERETFVWNGRFGQFPEVNPWPRPLQARPPVWITGVGNPNTMRMALSQGLGFNYFGFYGISLTGRRVFDRFWDVAQEMGLPRNPYRVGLLQTVAVADTDAEAERLYARHAEYTYRKGLGCIPFGKRSLPGAVDIAGVEAILRDAGDLGMGPKMRVARYNELVDSGAVIAGSAQTVADRLAELCRGCGIGNLHVMLGFGSMPRELVLENVGRFASQVAPRLRTLWQDEDHRHHWWPQRLGGVPADLPPGVPADVPAGMPARPLAVMPAAAGGGTPSDSCTEGKAG